MPFDIIPIAKHPENKVKYTVEVIFWEIWALGFTVKGADDSSQEDQRAFRQHCHGEAQTWTEFSALNMVNVLPRLHVGYEHFEVMVHVHVKGQGS